MIPELFTRMSKPPNFVRDLFHHRLDLTRLCDVAFDHERLFQVARDVLGVRFVFSFGIADEIDHALRAARPESSNHFRANPARAAGDEHDFAGVIKRISHGGKCRV